MSDSVNHPAHYGGKANPYEAIKVIEAWDLNFHLGNTVKYISRAGKKGQAVEDLKKARWYLDREITAREQHRETKACGCHLLHFEAEWVTPTDCRLGWACDECGRRFTLPQLIERLNLEERFGIRS